MNNEKMYKYFLEQAFQKIKQNRDPHPERPDTIDLGWETVKNETLFGFQDQLCSDYANIILTAKRISIHCLKTIITQLFHAYGIDVESIQDLSFSIKNSSPVYFAFKIKQNNELILFKDIEYSNLYKIKDIEPIEIQDLMNANDCQACKYVYLMYDKAYMQIIGHNDDESDPGRGYNLYSIKWFFETFFGTEESDSFIQCWSNYISQIQNYIDFTCIKNLNSNAFINFKRIVQSTIIGFSYQNLLQKSVKNQHGKSYQLDRTGFSKIENQFLIDKNYSILLGEQDFSESLITSEWLYDSMKKAKAIDLTVIGLGYFKAVEQLLFKLICLHKGEGRTIQKENAKKGIKIDLSADNINKKRIDSTLGSMATFFKDNIDLFRQEIGQSNINYVKEAIYSYKNLRNGYFHKDNIHSWQIIDNVRKESFSLLFLLLGSLTLSEDNKNELGYYDDSSQTDYYKLCEYINYHYNDLFFLKLDNNSEEGIFLAQFDSKTKTTGRIVEYSGVSFRGIENMTQVLSFTEDDDLPLQITLGKFVFSYNENNEIQIRPEKVYKVFENNSFIGPDIVNESGFSY